MCHDLGAEQVEKCLIGRFDPTDQYDVFQNPTFVNPAERQGFFHLIQISKAVTTEAREAFFKFHRLVFETTNALDGVLDVLGENTKCITSLSVNLLSSRVRFTKTSI